MFKFQKHDQHYREYGREEVIKKLYEEKLDTSKEIDNNHAETIMLFKRRFEGTLANERDKSFDNGKPLIELQTLNENTSQFHKAYNDQFRTYDKDFIPDYKFLHQLQHMVDYEEQEKFNKKNTKFKKYNKLIKQCKNKHRLKIL